jgi:hypothetical protein
VTPSRHLASVLVGLALAVTALRLVGCSGGLNPTQPDPHDTLEPIDRPDGRLDGDAAEDAS